jgi:alpha-amylase
VYRSRSPLPRHRNSLEVGSIFSRSLLNNLRQSVELHSRPPPMKSGLFWIACLLLASQAFAEESFFQHSVRSPRQQEVIYLLMPDRFANGKAENDTGGIAGGVSQSGFDPAGIYSFHGGDLAGVQAKLDYLHHLGITSIWMTPIFRNRAVQSFEEGKPVRTGYHGYWILDFTDVDPHFGNKKDLEGLITAASQRGIGIILDIVVNHTADVIEPQDGASGYQYKFSKPYLDANGNPFDDRDYIDSPNFPKLVDTTGFPATPVIRNPKDRNIKVPQWLNDPTAYHNRGEIQSGGESALYGDVAGLDDLFTEQPQVVQGMIDIYADWIANFAISGFRLDTAKHVSNEFWNRFVPAMREQAAKSSRKDFFIFGEVYDSDPASLSEFLHRASMASVLDFGFAAAALKLASGLAPPSKLADFFAKDGYYTTPHANAYGLVTFLGNHDVGRIAYLLAKELPTASDNELLSRDILAHALLLFTRGIPVIYYGDEQGFTGKGGDAAARQDMFGSKLPDFVAEKRVGGGNGAEPAFNEDHPLFRAIRDMISVRQQHQALQSGIQMVRYAAEQPGLFVVSRIDRDNPHEILVALNNSPELAKAEIQSLSTSHQWEPVFASPKEGFRFESLQERKLSIELPPLSVLVLRNLRPIEPSSGATPLLQLTVNRTSEIDDRWRIEANPGKDEVVSIAFGVRAKGTADYQFLGTADSPPYQIFPTRDAIPGTPELEFKAIARDLFGREASAEVEWKRRVPKKLLKTSSD